MKKLNKLFAILFAVLGVQTLSAQTDVTSTYLTNAGFETDGHQTGIKVPTGWTLGTTSGGYTSYRPISDTSTPNGSLPISNGVTAGASEGSCYLYMRTNWGASVCELTQTTQVLPAGKYKLMVDVALPQTQTSRLRTLTIKVTGSTSGTTNSVECCYNPSIWSTVCIPFEVSTEETVVISLYHNDTSGGCGDGVLTAVDNVRLLSYDYAALTSALTEAETLYDSSKEGATELNTAMNTAKSLTESSDKSTIASAAEALLNALDTYKQVQFVVPSSTDYTSWIANAQLETTTGGTVFSSKATMWNSNVPSNWYVTRAVNGNMNATTYGSGQSGNAFEIWATDANTVIGTFFQPISGLPAGKYTLKGYLQNSGKLFVTNGIENTEYSSSPSSTGSWQQFSVTFVKKSASDNLIIGAQTTAAQHFIVDGFSLECIGLDLLKLTSQRDGLVSDLEALQSTLPTTYYSNTVATAIETANAADTESTLTAAINNLSSILTTANSISDAYKQLKRLIDLCSEYTDPQHSNANSDEVLSTFNEAINTATTNGNAATTVDAINTVYSTLEGARQTYARNAVPVYPYPFDMTFLLPNTTFDSNIDGWTKTGGANWMSAGKNVECYNTTFEFSMEYTGLNSGSWEIQVDAFYRYGGYNNAEAAHNGGTEQLHAILYANNNTVAVKSIMVGANKAGSVGAITTNGVRVPDAPAHCDAYFATGCYANAIATVIADGKLKVGIKKETTQAADWTIFDNFKLIYKGIDVTDLQNALSALITTAYAIKEEKMGTAESAALNTALDNADATVTNADRLSEMISNLQSAYDDAVPSIDLYATVLPYITKAEGVDASIATTYRNQYDNGTITETAETVFQKLEVATYNYVTNNFAYPVALSDTWNSKGTNTQAATFSNEHWSGTTREYKNQDDNNGQGWNAQAWSIDFDQSVTLPAGDYVFKVAGRKSAGTTLELVVTMGETTLGTVNDFPSSNNARGINKAGAASFDPEDPAEFANNGNGFGWQWRYVKFTLDAEATVKVAVHAEANAYNNWVSFGDYTLQMTEETYLEANMDGLDAPTAAANSLVDTKPMGTAENTALKDALDLPVTTGAELLAKIEALETAVANANAWVTAYNEAKAPLVAALERFEADYNDAENGALDYMNKERWATAISMAQAAAEAKDVTDSYDGFEAATSNLVAALDAATVSVGEYADLKAAIETAGPLYNGGNWGDQPFQRPISAKESLNTTTAQATYDAATADGEAVTSLTEALNNGINTTLNAPEDGQRFYIEVATEGHSKLGNAVLATLGATGDNNPTGYGLNANNAVKGHLAQAFTFTQVEGSNLYNISIERPEGTVYLTYGSLNGSAAGWKNQQIQATTDPVKKGEFKIEATAKEGVLKILNTEDNNYLDCQNGGSIYTDTGIEAEEFNFVLASENGVTLTISAAEWATLILPFKAELPEGVKAYSCAEANGENLTLVEAESIDANTPYLVSGAVETYTFTGYGMADKDAYTEGLFTGTYVDYQTTAGSNTYVLQNGAEGVAFYLVGEEAQPTVKAYRCYMTYDAAAGAPVFRIGKGTTSIDNAQLTNDNVVIYDLMGRKVNTMVKGGMYIVNGKKVVIR